MEDIRKLTASCPICAEVKPRFHRNRGTLIKSTSPFERLNIDFKGPLHSSTNNKYILTIVDEYSRFPFTFACPDMTSTTVIKCLRQLFVIFGTPSYVHSDRGTCFISQELKGFLGSLGIASSRTTAYNPQGNGQCERYNGIIWRTIQLSLKSQRLRIDQWESVLQEALHAIRSLLCTATNCTPHERMFIYPRRSSNGTTVPTWLSVPGPVYLRKHVRTNKYEPLVEEVQLIEANPDYAHVRFLNGKETTVSTRHLAPQGDMTLLSESTSNLHQENSNTTSNGNTDLVLMEKRKSNLPQETAEISQVEMPERIDDIAVGRPVRIRNSPKYLEDFVIN